MDGLTYDEALVKRVGQFGIGQLTTLSTASICLIANAAAFFFWTFAAAANPIAHHHWECVQDHPDLSACQQVFQQEEPSSQEFCALPGGSIRWTSSDSLITQFSLVCADAWKVQFANSLMFVGALVGSGTFGFMCDRWGRKRPLFLATAVIAAAMYGSLAAPSYWVMAVLRAVTGFGAAGQSHCNFLLSTEPVGPAYRGVASICASTFWLMGEFVMVALGFALPNWRHLLLACASINAATLLLYPFVRESGRWLLSKGRTDEARLILQQLAKANGSQAPEEPLVSSHSRKQLLPDPEAGHTQGCGTTAAGAGSRDSGSSHGPEANTDEAAGRGDQPVTLGQLLRRRRLAMRLMISLITCFTLQCCYYGITMAAGAGMSGPIYVTFAIGVAAEAAAYLVVAPLVDRLGRHNIVASGLMLGGGACLACGSVKAGILQAVLAAAGKFGCSAASCVNGIYNAEMLPTSCRSSVMGICNQASRLGSITAPFLLMIGSQVVLQGHTQMFIPFTVFGALAVTSGLSILTMMPETLGAPMPENISDMENLLSVFAAKPWRHGFTACVAFIVRARAKALSRTTSRMDPHHEACSCSSTISTAGSVDVVAHVRVQLPAGLPKAQAQRVAVIDIDHVDIAEQ